MKALLQSKVKKFRIRQNFAGKTFACAITLTCVLPITVFSQNSTNHVANKNLKDWIEQTLKFDPSQEAAKARVESAEASHMQSQSAFLPKASLLYNWTNNENSIDRKLLTLNLQQNVFNGFSDWKSAQSTSLQSQAERLALDKSQDESVEKISIALLDLLLAQEQTKVFEDYRKILDRRVTELRRRMNIGRSRDVDILQNKISRLELERQIFSNTQNQYNAQLRIFEMTGESNAKIGLTFSDIIQTLSSPKYLREDFTQKETALRTEAAQKLADASQSAYLPSLSIFGNYFPVTNKAWSESDNDWSYGVGLEWNVFEGRAGLARIRQSNAKAMQERAELRKLQMERDRLRQNFMGQFNELKKQHAIIVEATDLATKALKSQERDFRLGLSTTLDLTTSDQQYLDLKIEQLRIEHSLAKIYAQSLPLGLKLGGIP